VGLVPGQVTRGGDDAGIQYTVLREPLAPELWEAFRSEYGPLPEEKRLGLYRLMQHLDAAMGNYLEPATTVHVRWVAWVWENFEDLVQQVEQL